MLQWQENAGLSSAQIELWLMDRSLERIFFSHLDILLYPSSLRSSMLSPKTRAFGPNTENWFALSFPSYQDRLSCLSPTALVLLPAGFITWNRTLHGNIHFFAAVRWTTCPLPTLLILAFSKWDGATWVTKMAERMFTLLKRQNQKTLLLMLLLHTWSMLQHGASLLFQHNSLWGHGVTWLWKFLFFTRLFWGSSVCFSAHWSGSEHGYVGRLRTSSPLHWHYPPALHAGSHGQPLNLPPAPWKHQPSPGENQCFAAKKHSGEATLQQRECTEIITGRKQCIFNGHYYLHIY